MEPRSPERTIEGNTGRPPPSLPPPRKKRVPRACEQCRRSKLKCDQKRPCTRCIQYRSECIYVEAVRDPVAERFEHLENEIAILRREVEQNKQCRNSAPTYPATSPMPVDVTINTSPVTETSRLSGSWPNQNMWASLAAAPTTTTPLTQRLPRKWHGFELNTPTSTDFVTRGLISEPEAEGWFTCFFSGCDRFVPAFSADDTYHSVRARSSLLFDTIVTFGARAAQGYSSPSFQQLHGLLRERLCNLLFEPVTSTAGGIEAIQALLIHACYADDGWLLISLAVRLAIGLDLPDSLESLLRAILTRKSRSGEVDDRERQLFRLTRVWCAVFNVEQILSLDGGKKPTIAFTTPRRLRTLCTHPLCTTTDLRLFAQVELNVMRVASYAALTSTAGSSEVENIEQAIESIVHGGIVDLDLWLDEWIGMRNKSNSNQLDNGIHELNIQIQHAYALLTLHLRALSATGMDNIAVMSESQQNLARAAKQAAELHLKLILTETGDDAPSDRAGSTIRRGYLAGFRYALNFVWAKCAFSVLLVLRLGMLLKDPPAKIIDHVNDARILLSELDKVGIESRYTRILALSVEKCEQALREAKTSTAAPRNSNAVGSNASNSTQTLSMSGRRLHPEPDLHLNPQDMSSWAVSNNNFDTDKVMATSMQQHAPSNAFGVDIDMQNAGTLRSTGNESAAEQEFQTYVPQEFLFEWAFPGLNLYYLPLDWQDLFVDFGSVF